MTKQPRLVAEFVGTTTLTAAVIGSGYMATNVSPDVGIQLLVNAFTTVAALVLLIEVFGPISGAHFNTLVTLLALRNKVVTAHEAFTFGLVQLFGALAGAATANLMFGAKVFTASTHERSSAGIFIGELIATAGLIFVIALLMNKVANYRASVVVALWIGAAFLFTASTSFANPTLTIARALTDSFAGISPASLPLFFLAQFLGAALGYAISLAFTTTKKSE